jgi:hypothetical protein
MLAGFFMPKWSASAEVELCGIQQTASLQDELTADPGMKSLQEQLDIIFKIVQRGLGARLQPFDGVPSIGIGEFLDMSGDACTTAFQD